MKTKYIIVDSYGKLPMFGGIYGPVSTPFDANINAVIAAVNSGKKVYEVNKANPKQKVLLTRHNVLGNNFKSTRDKAIERQKAFIKSQIAAKAATTVLTPAAVSTARIEVTPPAPAPVQNDSIDNFGKIGATDGFSSNIQSTVEEERI